MGAVNEMYLTVLDGLTQAGLAARINPDPQPTDDTLIELARQITADLGADGLLAAVDADMVIDLRDAYNQGRKPDRLDFDQVAAELTKLGVLAHSEHGCGGVAVLHAGPRAEWPDEDGLRPHAVTLGPGSFEGPGYSGAYGTGYELGYGSTDDDRDSEGVGEDPMPADVAVNIAAMVADVVARRQRFEAAVEQAVAGMWEAVATAYPEVTTGDFGPDETMHMEQNIRASMKLWLYYNRPDEGIAPTAAAAGQIVAAVRAAAIERLTPWVRLAGACADVGDMVHEALQEDARDRASEYDNEGDYADWIVWTAVYQRAEELATRISLAGPAATAELLVDLLGAYRAERTLGAVELSADQVDALGLDSTGTDGNERFPYTIGNLTDDERQRMGAATTDRTA